MKTLKICAIIFTLNLLTTTTFAQKAKLTPTLENPVRVFKRDTRKVYKSWNDGVILCFFHLPEADDIIDKYIKSIGGETAYRKITSRVLKGTVEVPAAGIKGTFESYQKAPNKVVLNVTIPNFGVIADGFDGANAWTSQPTSGLRDKSGEELDEVKRDSNFYIDIDLKTNFAKRETVKIERINGNDAYAVLLTPTKGATQTHYFDVKSGLLVRKDETATAPEGKTSVITYFSDYRNVDGVQFPFLLRVEQPQIAVTLKATEIKQNIAIDEAKFAKPTE